MAIPDRVKETSTTTGTGNITLLGAVTQFQPLSSAFTNGQSGITLCIADKSGSNWEISKCTLIDSTTISRNTVLSSSNAGSLVNFGVGVKEIFYTLSASDLDKLAGAASSSVSAVANSATSKLLIVEGTTPKQITVNEFLASVGTTPISLSAAASLSGTDVVVISQDGGNSEVKTTLSAIAAYVASTIGGATVSGAPTIGTATAGDGSASITFTAPVSNGGSAIISYTVTSSPSGITGTGSASPITVSGLSNGTAYTFTVKATNGVGVSAASAASNSVTPAASGSPAYLFAPVAYSFPTSGNISTNGYWGGNAAVYLKTTTGVTPANVKAGWSKSPTVAPAVYANTTLQADNGTGTGKANSFLLSDRTGGWIQGGLPSQDFNGLYGTNSNLYAWGTAGTYYLWLITDDGFAKAYDNNTGTPVGVVLS